MSTITKLNPQIRQFRAERRSLRVELAQTPHLKLEALALLSDLKKLARNPRWSGVRKQRVFDRLTHAFLKKVRRPALV